MSKATFLENTVFLSRSNLLTFSGIWSMVFGFWQKVFGRKFLAGFSWQQSVLLRELFQILLQVFFYLFLVWSDVSFDLWQNFHSRFVKISFLFFFRNFLSWLTSKILNVFQKIRILIEVFFIILTSVFPQRCVNCILNVPKNIRRIFSSLRTPGMFCQFRVFGNKS